MGELKRRELQDGEKVYFTAYTKGYGTAEFFFCPIWKRGKLKELFIYPKQQLDAKEYFHVEFQNAPDSFHVMSREYKGMDAPRAWLYFYCKEHKTQAFNCYVPKQAKYFFVDKLSTALLIFDNE